jgi:hypothetical protein
MEAETVSSMGPLRQIMRSYLSIDISRVMSYVGNLDLPVEASRKYHLRLDISSRSAWTRICHEHVRHPPDYIVSLLPPTQQV